MSLTTTWWVRPDVTAPAQHEGHRPNEDNLGEAERHLRAALKLLSHDSTDNGTGILRACCHALLGSISGERAAYDEAAQQFATALELRATCALACLLFLLQRHALMRSCVATHGQESSFRPCHLI